MMKPSSPFLQSLTGLILLMGLSKSDPDPLQHYCIADTKFPPFFINGAPCINPNLASSSHFTTSVLGKSGNTKERFNVTLTNTVNFPGINPLGLAMARIETEPDGLVPPHTHPRTSELTICLQGVLLVGFVDTSNRIFIQELRPGDSFVFPKGLIHFLHNLDPRGPSLAVSRLSGQSPGAQIASTAIFTSKPYIPDEVVKTSFLINGRDIAIIRKNLGG